MKALVVFLFVVLLLFVLSLSSQEVPSNSLRLVQVFFRHGARTPELKDVYPNDPHKTEVFLPMGWGQLTDFGMSQSYSLGKKLRERYGSFLGDIFYPEIVSVQSTDFDRTKKSALLVLAGLFPPSASQTWEEKLPWLPIPVSYEKDNLDYTLRRPNSYCPRYLKELEDVFQSDDIKILLKKKKKTLEYLTEHTGKSHTKLMNVFELFQTLTAETWMNLTLPEWTKSVYPEEITEIAAQQAFYENSNQILKRLNGGRSLKMVIDNMAARAAQTLQPSSRKIFLYSGHENNVINVLAAMNLYKAHIPNYSSAVIFELHYLEDEDDYAVKVLYSKSPAGEPEEQQLKGCDVYCLLEDFVDLTEPNVPVNYTKECESVINLD